MIDVAATIEETPSPSLRCAAAIVLSKRNKPYIPNQYQSIVHAYRWDLPDGEERALCGWRPPDTWHPKNGPAPLTAMPDRERCPKCLERIEREPAERYALMPPEDWIEWEKPRDLRAPGLGAPILAPRPGRQVIEDLEVIEDEAEKLSLEARAAPLLRGAPPGS